MFKTYFWRGVYTIPYGEGSIIACAESVTLAREAAFRAIDGWSSEDDKARARRALDADPTFVLDAGQAATVEWSE